MARKSARVCDMGSGLKLSLFIQDDGDVIVSVLQKDHAFCDESVEFCLSGTQSPATNKALHDLYAAMEEDEQKRPHNVK